MPIGDVASTIFDQVPQVSMAHAITWVCSLCGNLKPFDDNDDLSDLAVWTVQRCSSELRAKLEGSRRTLQDDLAAFSEGWLKSPRDGSEDVSNRKVRPCHRHCVCGSLR